MTDEELQAKILDLVGRLSLYREQAELLEHDIETHAKKNSLEPCGEVACKVCEAVRRYQG